MNDLPSLADTAFPIAASSRFNLPVVWPAGCLNSRPAGWQVVTNWAFTTKMKLRPATQVTWSFPTSGPNSDREQRQHH